ncbi:hypothetical protein [Bacillus velezensis]|uniref:hypothetical protein n=1 Tax=Bacillus velezensis TaxID=492670 RepID=UPI001F102E6B|nr:hypothetical protein [Bacillus velezensis]UMQ50200.1 hypothetical protein MKF36_19280 [Bacillus velezensis]
MKNEIDSFKYEQLDKTTAEFLRAKENNMREIVGRAYTELGRELKEAQERLAKNGYGCFDEWITSLGMNKMNVNRLIHRYSLVTKCDEQADILEDLPVSLTYEIARPSAESTEPKRQAKQAVLNGEVKTLKEYRELLAEKEAAEAALKQAESQRTLAEQEADILREKLERAEEAEPEVQMEYVEVPTSDPKVIAENERYKELFGDVSMYEGKTTRVTNGDAITYTVREFSEDVRKFVEKYGHLTHFAQEFNGMIDEGKVEYGKAIHAMQTFLNSMRRVMNEKEAVIING